MDIRALINDSSKRTINNTVELVLKDPELFSDYLELTLQEKAQISQRAARVVYYSIEKDITLIEPHVKKIIKKLPKVDSESIRGTLIGIFAKLYLPEVEELLGELADCCFTFINMQSKSESQKVYSLDTLYKISNIYPEIKNELALNIEKLFPYNKAAFQVRARRILKSLYKDLNLNIEVPECK